MTPRPSHRMSVRRRRTLGDSLAFKTFALMIIAGLTVLLWIATAPQISGLFTQHGAIRSTEGTVTYCPSEAGRLGACHVTLDDPAGGAATRTLAHVGLVGVGSGDRVPLWVDADGGVAVAGWRPLVDTLVVLALALTFTVFTVNAWRRVLEHHDVPYDGGEPDDD